ncbi:uncharacterized protein LOC141630686 [Silene latifolia]|uniref:uncharacterized protein LOC141630686 n=1 Tax=Silene latifolia TaxID=37657 RepID=UPI003D7824B1
MIRADLYQGIVDTVVSGEVSATKVGKRIVLPPSFLGGPRDMKKWYLNSMALVQSYGKPDLFIIMTCNANWPEIKKQLAEDEKSQNRPDIVSRVFTAKLLPVKKQIVDKRIFREVAAYVYVVEFQKRGFPHVHFLIILKDGHKLKSPADYDKFVSAEIPPMENPTLHVTVLKHMMHGPCDKLNPTCSCMKHAKTAGHWKYEYPKSYRAETTTNNVGYLCSTMHAVKYLYKYVYKGHDRISFSLAPGDEPPVVDEITQYQSGRWPKDPSHLWNTHYDALSNDYHYRFPGQPQKVKRLTARSVERYLEAMGKTLETFGLEHLETSSDHELRRTRDIIDALDAPIPEECRRCKALLNTAQKEAFDTIMEHVNASKPGAFFVDRRGGTGKTFMYNTLYVEVRLVGEIILPTATSGIAASNIPTGHITHSRFRIPLDSDVSLACDVPRQGSLAALIRAASMIIWDEASMEKRQNVESLDLLLRDLCDPNQLFWGKIVVALLTPLNDDVDAINNVLIGKFPGNPVFYKSHDSMIDDNCAISLAAFINKLNPGGMNPHELILKENCPVILLRNLQPSFGLCNGTWLICKRFLPNSIKCAIMSGNHKGEHVFIPRIKLQPTSSTNYPFQLQRNQFPLKLSFAMTINKCQGQTLSQFVVYLPKPCFAHGQLYVALSRAQNANQVTVIAASGPEEVSLNFVKNILFYDVLTLAWII